MGDVIFALRVSKKFTQRELAQRCGVTAQCINMIERGKRTPGLKLAKRIAEVLGVTIDDLVA